MMWITTAAVVLCFAQIISGATISTTSNTTGPGNSTVVESRMCYQCADSSDEDGKNDCQTYLRTMRKYRRLYERKHRVIDGKYVKNCTSDQKGHFCMVTRVEDRGKVTSYIRGCTNLLEFGLDFSNTLKGLEVVQADNQTSCTSTGQGYLVCVSACEGDFCNGPFSSGNRLAFNTMLGLAALLAIWVVGSKTV